MSSTLKPLIQTFLAGGTIVEGHAVKFGADSNHVVECTAETDDGIGIAAGAASLGDKIEVARPGGGAKVMAHTTITRGQSLSAYTDGTLQPVSGSGKRILAIADDSAVAGDIFAAVVQISQSQGTD